MSYRSDRAGGNYDASSAADVVAHLMRAYEISPELAGELVGKHIDAVRRGIDVRSHVSYLQNQIAIVESLPDHLPQKGDPAEIEVFDEWYQGEIESITDETWTVYADEHEHEYEPFELVWTGEKWIAADERDDDD